MAKKPQNPNSLKNLQPPFVSGDPRIAKAHTKEANAKRVESLKDIRAQEGSRRNSRSSKSNAFK